MHKELDFHCKVVDLVLVDAAGADGRLQVSTRMESIHCLAAEVAGDVVGKCSDGCLLD